MSAGNVEARYPTTPQEWTRFPAEFSDDELLIGGWQVMQGWERPLMAELARQISKPGASVLEIGFGMGISANAIVARGCAEYTVIEAHPEVAARAREWGRQQAIPVSVLEGFWQEVVPGLAGEFDGVLFDTYPLAPEERGRNHFEFIPVAKRLLGAHGRLTYYSDEATSFREDHLKLLLEHYDQVKLVVVRDLEPPADCEYWHQPTMIVPVASHPFVADIAP